RRGARFQQREVRGPGIGAIAGGGALAEGDPCRAHHRRRGHRYAAGPGTVRAGARRAADRSGGDGGIVLDAGETAEERLELGARSAPDERDLLCLKVAHFQSSLDFGGPKASGAGVQALCGERLRELRPFFLKSDKRFESHRIEAGEEEGESREESLFRLCLSGEDWFQGPLIYLGSAGG